MILIVFSNGWYMFFGGERFSGLVYTKTAEKERSRREFEFVAI